MAQRNSLKFYALIVMIICVIITLLYIATFASTLAIYKNPPVPHEKAQFIYDNTKDTRLEYVLNDYNKPIFSGITEAKFAKEKNYYYALAYSDQRQYFKRNFMLSAAICMVFLVLFVIHYRIYKNEK